MSPAAATSTAHPVRYARGWHCLGLAAEFRDGQPHRVNAFGTTLVVWADSDGALQVLDGYCRHMGGDLTQGTIKDGAIACPFHDWRWEGSGRCSAIPYAKRVPPRARTRSWITCERNRQLFVWHDPEGNPPIEAQAIPEIPGIETPGTYSDFTWNRLLVEGANCREIIDNNVDMAHFFYIHFAYPTSFRNVLEGHTAAQVMTSKARPDHVTSQKFDVEKALLRSSAAYYGPSYMIDYLENDFGNGFSVKSVLINCHYPIHENAFVLQYGVAVQAMPGLDPATMNTIAARFSSSFEEGFQQDVAIWQNKIPMDNPLLCEEDGPLYQHRRWYQQFYVDVADITPDMTDRFEFEVDTSHANTVWQQQVREQLASRVATAP